MSEAYRRSGVDLDAKERLTERLKAIGARATRPEVLAGIGGFGGLVRLQGYRDPVLVAGTDGVGTKLELARRLHRMAGVGQDALAMVANDVLCEGAQMLFFLDYIGTGRLVPEEVAEVVEGVADACARLGCALLGGETAELPGLFPEGGFDLVGFGVGVVERDQVVTGADVQEGDALIGLPSDGLHSNGFSLVRRIVAERALDLEGEHGLGAPLGELLLRPTRLYGPELAGALQRGEVHGIAHITGGGIPGNVPRMLPHGLCAAFDARSWSVPPELELLLEAGDIRRDEAYRVFNMGLGLVLAVPPAEAPHVLAEIRSAGGQAHVVGAVCTGEGVRI